MGSFHEGFDADHDINSMYAHSSVKVRFVEPEPKHGVFKIKQPWYLRDNVEFWSNGENVTGDVRSEVGNIRKLTDEERTLVTLKWNISC